MSSRIIADWRRAALGYSFAFSLLGALTFLLPFVLWNFFSIELDPVPFGWAGLGFMLVGAVGRFIAQPDGLMRNFARIGLIAILVIIAAISIARASPLRAETGPIVPGAQVSEAGIMVEAVPLIKEFEGVRLKAYRDVVGVWTICMGSTRGVTPGMELSRAECEVKVRAEALEYWRGVSGYMSQKTLRDRITVPRGAAWTSFAINVGIDGAGRSTATRRLNSGNIAGACTALTWWNKAGGKIFSALVTRRGKEYDLCMIGVRA